MQYKEYTENDIAIQFEGTTEDGGAPNESLIGEPTKKDLNSNNALQLAQKKLRGRRKQKNESIFL